jgi:hypothetical protein
VVLWEAGTRQRPSVSPLVVKEGNVLSVAFSPDGKTIAAGYRRRSDSSGVVLWEVDLESWIRLAGRRANRNFTNDESRQYFPDEEYHCTFPDLPIPVKVQSQQEKQRP